MKVMLIFFFDNDGMIHHEFVRAGHAVNWILYKEVLKHLIEKFR